MVSAYRADGKLLGVFKSIEELFSLLDSTIERWYNTIVQIVWKDHERKEHIGFIHFNDDGWFYAPKDHRNNININQGVLNV